MRKVGSVALLILLGSLMSSSCAKQRSVTIDLLDACAASGTSFREAADFVQFAVFPNECPKDELLAAGDTRTAKQTWTVAADSNLPDVGDLPQSKFGFAVILRDKECTVLGYGCTVADLESIAGVKIAACDWSNHEAEEARCNCQLLKGGGCFPPTVCQEGACKKPTTPDPGGCSLVIDQAGALPPPPAVGTQMTGPAIVATDNGFMLGYRDQAGEKLRAVISFLTDTGELTEPQNFDLDGCSTQVPSDGVGMAFANGTGMMTTSLPDCGQGAGAVFIPFKSDGQVEQAAGPRNKTFKTLWLAQGSPIAAAATKGEWELVYRVQHAPPDGGTAPSPWVERVVLQGAAFKLAVATAKPFGDADVPYAMVATSNQVRAFLAPIQTEGGSMTVVKVGDRSSDTLSLDAEFSLSQTAGWAALTAWNNRVAAAIPAGAGMTVQPAEFNGGTVSPKATIQVGSGTAQGGALAVLRSHLFVAQGKVGGITVYRLDGADGNLANKPAVSMEFPSSFGPANLTAFDGARIAMAAARDRVAVAWVTKGKLAAGEPAGGWALLRCAD